MKYRNRLNGLIVFTDREKTGAKWERLDVDDLEVLLGGWVPPAFSGFVSDEEE